MRSLKRLLGAHGRALDFKDERWVEKEAIGDAHRLWKGFFQDEPIGAKELLKVVLNRLMFERFVGRLEHTTFVYKKGMHVKDARGIILGFKKILNRNGEEQQECREQR